ncbi:MAG: hypothetical protein QMC70_04735 [Bacteroidia bacterium]
MQFKYLDGFSVKNQLHIGATKKFIWKPYIWKALVWTFIRFGVGTLIHAFFV